MFEDHKVRPARFARFARPVPRWYRDAKLGFIVHWGPYSVPAWAETLGEHGAVDPDTWFEHCPYAEWYANTIRLPASPAGEHHRRAWRGMPYEGFLDLWDASRFDPDGLVDTLSGTGAGYLLLTTKHHDGITLWDAPGTGTRNTVARGPKRDLVEPLARATRAAGMRFGVYYSGGLDWAVTDLPPIVDHFMTSPSEDMLKRPHDAGYAAYAFGHVADLIRRYRPDILWGDVDWPEAGLLDGPTSLERLLDLFYGANPDGVINDRWGPSHWDFRTSEYQTRPGLAEGEFFENCRGIGYSFAYNQLEDERHSLDGTAAIKHFLDIASRGGNLLLNVGLMQDGTIPPLQRRTVEALAEWNAVNGSSIFASTVLDREIAQPTDQPWVRWTRTGGQAHAFISATQPRVTLAVGPGRLDEASGRYADGAAAPARPVGAQLEVTLPPATRRPVQVTFDVHCA